MPSGADASSRIMGIVGLLIGLGGILGCLAILGWQVFHYLRSGYWIAISVIDGLTRMGVEWAIYPTDWIGLHNMLGAINLGAAIMICGVVIGGFLMNADEDR